MRLALVILLALTACGRSSQVNLPKVAGGVAIEAEAKHSMSIDSRGRISVDGVEYSTDVELEKALDCVATAMHNNEALANKLGRTYMADEPFLVRIDRSIRFDDTARWLWAVRQRSLMYRTWIAVLDEHTGEPRCLRVEHEPEPQLEVAMPLEPVDLSKPWRPGPRVQVWLAASDRPWWNKETGRAPAWYVRRWSPGSESPSREMTSWDEVRRAVDETLPTDRYFAIDGALPVDTRWSEVVPIVAEALDRWHAEIGL